MKSYISILLLGLSLFAHAQQKISGIITDSQKEPLLGVEVYIEDLQKGTSTNESGYYQLTNLPSTPIKITVTYLGFETQTKTINLQQTATILDFTLNETIFKMDEIIISTPFNKLQSENVMKVERATIQQLNNKGAITLIEGISSIAGVSQVSTGVGIGKPVIRGLRGNRVLVYTQGIRLENQQFGDEHGLGINESSIESIEVIKGPASLLYGSDALGGVLYFIPTKFAKSNTYNFNFNQKYFSNTQGSTTAIGIKKSFDSWKFLANGSYNMHSDYKLPTKNRITNSRFNETILNAAIGFNSKVLSSTLRFNFNATNVGIPEEIGIQNTNKNMLLPYQELSNKMISLNNTFFFKNSKFVAVFGYTLNNRKEFEEEETNAAILEPALHLNLKTFSYDAKWHLPKFKKLETILGMQGLYQKNKNFGNEILIPDATKTDFGIFLTNSYKLKNNFLQGGIRFDTRKITTAQHSIIYEDEELIFEAIDKTFRNISASVGYKTTLFKKVTSRFNVASGFRAPNLAELTSNGVHHGTNRFEIGAENLKNEQNFQSDISLEYNTNHFEIFANGFYNHINNYIFISPTGELKEGNFVYTYIQDNATLYGGEFGMHLHPHPYDWLHINSLYELVIGKQNNGNYLPLIPAHKLTNTIRTEFDIQNWFKNGYTSISLESTFEQNKISAFETPTNNYNIVNIGVGGTLNLYRTNFNLNLNINNVFNKSYISHLSRLKVDNIYDIGRNIILAIKISLK